MTPFFSDISQILSRQGIRSRMLLKIVKWSLGFSLVVLPAPAKSSEYRGWKEQKFSLFSSNDFVVASDGLDIIAEGTVSLLWSAVPEDKRSSAEAEWSWEVFTSVPPTDLTVKGGDDRNIAVYFVFAPEDQVEELATDWEHFQPVSLQTSFHSQLGVLNRNIRQQTVHLTVWVC